MRDCASGLLELQGKRRDLVADIATYREQRTGQAAERPLHYARKPAAIGISH